MHRPEGFRGLAELLRAPVTEATPIMTAPPEEPLRDEVVVARNLRLFHARIAEAVEDAVETLCNDLAAEVLGRELQLAPADIAAIVQRILQRYTLEMPVRVRVHPDALAQFADSQTAAATGALPAIGDPGLRHGDAVLELRDGAIDASLGVRLEAVLRAL